ncbi:MAG TPA: ABC transporter permease [Gammaproteobacteria bacterium]|nr:ABC transporter permease [Gammaproteobacteria bacterium]
MRLLALIRKEWLLLLRDWHALFLLFAMPAVFILVMSLVLQNAYAVHQGASVRYYLADADDSPASTALVERLAASGEFTRLPSTAPASVLEALVRGDRAQFLVLIPPGFGRTMTDAHPLPLKLLAGPGVEPSVYQLFLAELRGDLAKLYLQQSLAVLAGRIPGMDAGALDLDAADKLLTTESLYQVSGRNEVPSSVQQNVPAWLLFAMFFIAIPLSTTWVQERQQGTYARLRSMGLAAPSLLTGKLLPYVGINLLQVTLMLAVGVYLVPLLGGDRLTLGVSWAALCLMAAAVSFASVSYALLIANLVATGEQATIFTGAANLLMAAVGGIMVPRFLMPPLMQTLSDYSPMAWGLDGFLDVFLRQGGAAMAAPPALKLCLFGLACLTAAALRIRLGKGR